LTLRKNIDFNVEYKRIQPQIHRGIPHRNLVPTTQVMEPRSPDLVSHFESHWNYGKNEHENGLKM